MDPILEFRACFSTQLERFDGRPASLDAGLQSAAAVRLSAAGSLPPSEGSHRYYPSHRRSHASRCGHSSRAHSLGDFPAEHELTRASEPRPVGGADAPAPSLFTCPQLCHQGDLLSITNCPLRWRPRALRAFPRGSANASPNSARARSGTPGLQIRLWRIKYEYDSFFLWRCADVARRSR